MSFKRDRDAVINKRWFRAGYRILMLSCFLGNCVWVTGVFYLLGIISEVVASAFAGAFTMGCIGGCIIGLFFWLISLRYDSDLL